MYRCDQESTAARRPLVTGPVTRLVVVFLRPRPNLGEAMRGPAEPRKSPPAPRQRTFGFNGQLPATYSNLLVSQMVGDPPSSTCVAPLHG